MSPNNSQNPTQFSWRQLVGVGAVAASVAALVAWAVVVFHTPNAQASVSDRIAALALIATIVAAGVAFWSARSASAAKQIAEAARIHQVLMDVLSQYRSVEMHVAVRAIWRHYREHGEVDFVQAHSKVRRADEEKLKTLEPTKVREFTEASLESQRRRVTHFYMYLGGLYGRKLIPASELFQYWCEGDLCIIPKVLIPIELELAKEIETTSGMTDSLQLMQKLYDDSRKYGT